MKVILKQDYEQLGNMMSVVTVKDGFARNFLIPRGIAVPATDGNLKMLADQQKFASKREIKKLAEAREIAKKVEAVPCTIPVKTGEEDKLFGSVGTQDIAEFLKKEGFEIERSQIQLDDPIKQLGVYEVSIKLYRNVFAKLKVWVVKDEKAA